MLRLILLFVILKQSLCFGPIEKSTFFHEFYLGICEMEYNKSTGSLEISIRLFEDDIERAVFKYNKGKIYDTGGNKAKESNKILSEYILSKFAVMIDKTKKSDPDFLGWETEEEAIWCYFEIKQAGDFKELTIYNTLLTELFENQKNLIYLKKDNSEKSVILDKNKYISTIKI